MRGYILADSIIVVIDKMRNSCEKNTIIVLELTRTWAMITKKLYEYLVKHACITIKKVGNNLIDYYAKKEEVLIISLELMKNKKNLLIFNLLIKVSIIQLVIKCNQLKN